MSRTAHTYNDAIAMSSPERCLLAAIIKQALSDALHGRGSVRADAHAYLAGPNFEADAAWLDLDPAYVRKLLKEKPMPEEPDASAISPPAAPPGRTRPSKPRPSKRPPDDILLSLHRRHLDGESAGALAAEAGIGTATLTGYWRQQGLNVVHWGRVRGRQPKRLAAETAVKEPDGPPFDLADFGYTEGPGREQFRKPEVAEQELADNDAWFERVRVRDDRLSVVQIDDTVMNQVLGLDDDNGIYVGDPKRLEPIWQQYINGSGHEATTADVPLATLVEPPVAAIAAWVGRLRAVREELKGMGITLEGKLSVTLDL